MKTILKDVPVFKQVPDGFKQVPFYVTDDGKEFTNQLAAKNHENSIKREENFSKKYQLKHIKLFGESVEGFEVDAIYVVKIDEDFIRDLAKHYNYSHFSESGFKLGWNLIQIDDSGDRVHVSYSNLNSFISDTEKEIENKKLDLITLKSLGFGE